jgi:hypothetical protein
MSLLLIKFHMYLEFTILQDLYTNTVENKPKGAIQRSILQNCATE